MRIKDFFKTIENIKTKVIKNLVIFSRFISVEFPFFLAFFSDYLVRKGLILSFLLEGNKNKVVKNVLIKRGKGNRIFLHIGAMSILTLGIIISPLVSDSNPFSNHASDFAFAQNSTQGNLGLLSQDIFSTQESQKPRDKIITYSVQKGDTISTIAKKFGVSEDTVRWTNNLKTDTITVDDELKILPVTGVAHKVERGDSVYSIAKKYSANAQAIVDFPFNDFVDPQTFSLVEGQILIVPDGTPPTEKPAPVRQYIAQTGPVTFSSSGFVWPVPGIITQLFSWYHKGIDVGAPVGTPIVAAQNGRVNKVYNGGWNFGYGTHVLVQGDNGYTTLYAHMEATNVSPGQTVEAGKTVLGWVGLTGRTTGPHLHFEVRDNGSFFNPLGFLR